MMKRCLKNGVMIIVCLILIFLIVYTGYSAKNKLSKQNDFDNSISIEKPDGDFNQDSMEKPGGDFNRDDTTNNEPPEKPDQDNSTIQDKKQDDVNFDNEKDKDMPEKKDDAFKDDDTLNKTDYSFTPKYYILFTIISLLLFLLVIYLIMSKFNKKTFKETILSEDKMIAFILSTIILTATIVYGSSYVTNKFVLNKKTQVNNTSCNISYSAVSTIDKDKTITNESYESDEASKNALLVSGNVSVSLIDIDINKTGDTSNQDSASFYGINAALLAKDGANVSIENASINTEANGANGVFSYGGNATTNNSTSDGTSVNIKNSTINTTKDNSGGIMTTGGGVMNASNLNITTSGISSAAIRTDRGGGVVNVDGGTYKTTNQGSPVIYSTANITVKNASLISEASEGIIIEGKNSVSIENVTLDDSNTKLNGKSTTYKNIFMYESTSGDAASGTSEFTSKNSTIKTNKGDTFYVTNSSAKIELTNNEIINNDTSGNFLRAQADSWGKSGSNGGNVTLIMNKQTINGNIVIDVLSTLDMSINSKSNYTGIINGDTSAKNIKLTIDASSTITLMGDSYVSELSDSDNTYSNINFNGYKLYVNGSSIN